ncbi:hypothetical protein V6Z11_D10G151800 [Gossypium hirsutum]
MPFQTPTTATIDGAPTPRRQCHRWKNMSHIGRAYHVDLNRTVKRKLLVTIFTVQKDFHQPIKAHRFQCKRDHRDNHVKFNKHPNKNHIILLTIGYWVARSSKEITKMLNLG